jgi:hypothetical protein
MADNLPREFLHERDARIFALKKSGLSNQDIAKRFDMKFCGWSWRDWMKCRNLCGL